MEESRMIKQKLLFVIAAMLVAAAISHLSHAGTWKPALDEELQINDGDPFVLNQPVTFQVNIDPSDRLVTGFSFMGDVFLDPTGPPIDVSWTQLTITAPDNSQFVVGGTSGFDTTWDFGSQSTSGSYAHGIGGDQWNGDGLPEFAFDQIPIGGMWQFTFVQTTTFGSFAEWSNVEITLHSIPSSVPSPGGLAIVGLVMAQFKRRKRQVVCVRKC